MTRTEEQILFREVWRADTQIAGLLFHLFGQFFQLLDHHAAVRQPQRQARAHFIIEHEDFQLLAQLAMIALLGFFQLMEIVLELLRILPGRAVDALEHLVVLIAAPVRARNGHQLEGILLDLFRVLRREVRGTDPRMYRAGRSRSPVSP